MRALPINVYRDNSLGDCTNGGISSVYDRLLLLCEDGQVEIDPENPPKNLVKIVERNLFGRIHKHIEPVAKPEGAGWMYGGNIACTSDSRFNSDYPLKIHDRQESWELYESMSD